MILRSNSLSGIRSIWEKVFHAVSLFTPVHPTQSVCSVVVYPIDFNLQVGGE